MYGSPHTDASSANIAKNVNQTHIKTNSERNDSTDIENTSELKMYQGFRSDHWLICNNYRYVMERMLPVRILATKLLEIPELQPWWAKLCLGEYAFDDSPQHKYYLKDVDPTPENITRTKEIIEEAADYITLRFRSVDFHSLRGIYAQCKRMTSSNAMLGPPTFCHPSLRGKSEIPAIMIEVHKGYLDYFSRPSSEVCPKAFIRTAFHLAMSLTHELTHAIDFLRRDPLYLQLDLWHSLTDREPETGRSWEAAIFPFKMEGPLPPFKDINRNLLWAAAWNASWEDASQWSNLPTAWAQLFFDTAFWNKVRQEGWGMVNPRYAKVSSPI